MSIHEKMRNDLSDKMIFEKAKEYALAYSDAADDMEAFPSKASQLLLKHFEEPMIEEGKSSMEILQMLNDYGAPNTVAQTGGRYYGFVNGGAVPVSLAAKWMADVWDQNGGLYNTSPINAKLESVCESWLKDIFDLPKETVAGFVSGTSTANLCALLAARYQLLKNLGWDINLDGLYGAPKLRILAHREVHASIKKTLVILGYGKNNIEWIPSDDQGRIVVDALPEIDSSCLILLQAGNANTGAFDDFKTVCTIANKYNAWVHIDGAFGLWAHASEKLKYLTQGIELASSWAVDGHKTLNTPYDLGIVMCRYPDAMISALQATGAYLVYSEYRDPILYTTEMSKRARAIDLWSTLSYLGKKGIDELVTGLYIRAKELESGLSKVGLTIVNDVVFNQVMVAYKGDAETKALLKYIQESGVCWLGGTTWDGRAAIRISVCSWKTNDEDIEKTIDVFREGIAFVNL